MDLKKPKNKVEAEPEDSELVESGAPGLTEDISFNQNYVVLDFHNIIHSFDKKNYTIWHPRQTILNRCPPNRMWLQLTFGHWNWAWNKLQGYDWSLETKAMKRKRHEDPLDYSEKVKWRKNKYVLGRICGSWSNGRNNTFTKNKHMYLI